MQRREITEGRWLPGAARSAIILGLWNMPEWEREKCTLAILGRLAMEIT
jgi:hypothetical protein